MNAEGSPSTSQTPAATTTQTAPATQEPTLHDVKINGQASKVTLQELIAGYQKNGAADQFLSEAKQLASDHKNKLALADSILAAKGGDPDAWSRVGRLMNIPDDEIEAALTRAAGQPETKGGRPAESPASAGPVDYSQLPPAISKFFTKLQEAGVDPGEYAEKSTADLVAQAKTKVTTEVRTDLAQDPNLKYFLDDNEQAGRVVQLVEDAMRRRYLESGGRLQYGPDLRRSAIQEARATVEALGIQPKSKATAGMWALGGGSGSLDQRSHRQAAGERPKMFNGDDKFHEWVTNRIAELALESPQ